MSFWRRLLNYAVPHHSNAYRPHLLRRGWLVFFLAMVLATEGFLVASLVARQSNGSFLANVIASQLITYTNDERLQNKVATLTENAQLDAAAQAKANDMAAKSYFSHTSPDGKQPWDFISASGYNYQYAGENLAVRFVDSQDVVNAWMASPTHRANIVKPVYRQIGIGIAEGIYKGSTATFVVQYFGTPAGSVLGAEVGPVGNPNGLFNTFTRQVSRLFSDPESSAGWVFGGVATLLILVIGLTFFFHIQIQASNLLLSGAVVAGIALFFLSFNGALLSAPNDQTASVVQVGSLTTVIDDMATSTP